MPTVTHGCEFCGREADKQIAVHQVLRWACDTCIRVFLAGVGAGVTAAHEAARTAGAAEAILEAIRKKG